MRFFFCRVSCTDSSKYVSNTNYYFICWVFMTIMWINNCFLFYDVIYYLLAGHGHMYMSSLASCGLVVWQVRVFVAQDSSCVLWLRIDLWRSSAALCISKWLNLLLYRCSLNHIFSQLLLFSGFCLSCALKLFLFLGLQSSNDYFYRHHQRAAFIHVVEADSLDGGKGWNIGKISEKRQQSFQTYEHTHFKKKRNKKWLNQNKQKAVNAKKVKKIANSGSFSFHSYENTPCTHNPT